MFQMDIGLIAMHLITNVPPLFKFAQTNVPNRCNRSQITGI